MSDSPPCALTSAGLVGRQVEAQNLLSVYPIFALTGALQLFRLHEGHRGDAYQPPAWVAKLGSLHKNQTLAERPGPPPGSVGGQMRSREVERDAGKPSQSEERRRDDGRRQSKFTLALKWFFLATSIGLAFKTVIGIYMAFKLIETGL